MAKEPRPKGYPKLKNYKPSQFMLPTSHYDKKKADRAVTFIENLCHTKGKWAGTPFWLLPWQEQLIRDIFGIVKPDGNRQFRTAFVEICKKVGKSELAAAVALYLLYADNEPSLGYTVDIERLRDAYREAKQNPADEVTFKWLRCNMWVSSTVAWIPDAIYRNESIEAASLEGRDCYAGLDLSSTGDITALVLIFPPRDENEKYVLLPYFWIPEETIPRRVKANSVPYDIWEKQGYIMSTEGNVIHYDFIEKFIMYLSEKYHILEIAVDRWNATQMIQNLEGEGFTIVPFGQGFSSMSAPTKEFYRLLMEGRIIHGGNPVLRWMAGNVVIDTDPAGNIKVTKAKSKEKIDGIVAAIMALDRCIRQEGQRGSVYDERGLLVF